MKEFHFCLKFRTLLTLLSFIFMGTYQKGIAQENISYTSKYKEKSITISSEDTLIRTATSVRVCKKKDYYYGKYKDVSLMENDSSIISPIYRKKIRNNNKESK
ncbi:MAG: hypothetical protein AB1304_05630 [Bacteroidota bacterium]